MILSASSWFLVEKWRFQLEAKSAGQALADESFVVSVLDWLKAFLEKLKPTRTTNLSASHSDLEDPVSKKGMTHDLKPGGHVKKTTSVSNDAFLMSDASLMRTTRDFKATLCAPANALTKWKSRRILTETVCLPFQSQ